METNNRTDNQFVEPIIAALLRDVQNAHSEVFTPRACRLTTAKAEKRFAREGMGFLTKTLPRLGKALDRALLGDVPLDSASVGFQPIPSSKLPRFLGELFKQVFSHDGWILPTPCVKCIKTLREVLYCFYKYELPFSHEQEHNVVQTFIRTEKDIEPFHTTFSEIADLVDCNPANYEKVNPPRIRPVIRTARKLLAKLFAQFDPYDIFPRHGPGAVSTKEKLWDKYRWSKVSARIIASYPLDEYFYTSLTHVCDRYQELQTLEIGESSAKVCLVPKDSRGPRLISCEPLAFQWVQQGLGKAIVEHVESHFLTKYNVHFTDQQPNQRGALLGSLTGKYATLDLKEASDRVTVGLVRLLFPEPTLSCLLNCRTLSTVLPDGEVQKLNKFAPMGSALCFPVLALTIWALLTAALPDADAESILVYGDDVVVPTAQAANAIDILELFGLKVNRDKSCYHGFFRESCGVDAYRGVSVTPVRFRTVWTHHRSPSAYASWIAYANSLYARSYHHTYDYIVEKLVQLYGPIPDRDMGLPVPSLVNVPVEYLPRETMTEFSKRKNDFQRKLYKVWDLKAPVIKHEIDGWSMLLRYFSEGHNGTVPVVWEEPSVDALDFSFADIQLHGHSRKAVIAQLQDTHRRCLDTELFITPFSASSYTKRRSSILVRCWR